MPMDGDFGYHRYTPCDALSLRTRRRCRENTFLVSLCSPLSSSSFQTGESGNPSRYTVVAYWKNKNPPWRLPERIYGI